MTDFEFARYVATEQLRKECSVDACANSQNIIEVEDGGTVKNVIIADGSKGIWCKGSCTLENIFTQSGAGTTTITGFCAENFGKLWRSCGEGCKQHTRNVIINNSKFKGPGLSIISLNKNYQDTMKISNIKLYGQICFGCQDYIGIEGKSNNMQPTDQCTPLENCQKNVCKYQASDFIKDASFETCPSGLKQN
uniref:Probable pectate lyase F n=1 Tax=Meloidogyne hapla TaxID=6305 RepID=A0A1I8BI02_MELHA